MTVDSNSRSEEEPFLSAGDVSRDFPDSSTTGFPTLNDDDAENEFLLDGANPKKHHHHHRFAAGGSRGHGFLSRFQARRPATIIALLAIVLFAVITSAMMIMIPMFRLMEDALCHVYYHKDPSEHIDERECKVDSVQSELAFLGGWGALISSLVSMVAALPYGVLADRIGRKTSFLFSFFGILLGLGWGPLVLLVSGSPNMYLVITGCLFFIVGGGVPVAMNALNAMAADVNQDGDKAAGFLYLSFGAVSGTMVGPVLSGILMEGAMGPWLPISLVFTVIAPFVLCILLFIPETLSVKPQAAAVAATTVDQQPFFNISKKSIREAATEVKISLVLIKDINVILTLVNYFIQAAITTAYSTTLSQYVSKYFGWTLAESTYRLAPPLTMIQLGTIVIIPMISKVLTSSTGRFRLSTFSADLLLTKVSLVFIIFGALVEGVSEEVVLFIMGLAVGTLGASNSPLCRSVTTAYVESDQTSRLYALLSVLETSGAVLAGPVLAWLFSTGLEKRGIWKGLPWFYIAVLATLSLTALLFVRPPREKDVSVIILEDEEAGDFGYQEHEERA
ncbi:major facilitator superfamily domain-containing protein [Bombardia bombarda]|uniref:Major facilitator superfamily domain-containing protein n=1 Tax=Bombardia bombarda TaxID=252184 RepID=A0AA39WCE5_9PEZI|nr:major facilitator superfamily domain-containing protein [Bombardia bombarda]